MTDDGWSFELLDRLLREAGEKVEAIAERGGRVLRECDDEERERISLRLFTIRRHVETISSELPTIKR